MIEKWNVDLMIYVKYIPFMCILRTLTQEDAAIEV